jgi:prenyltransferase beta subunit
MLCIPSDAPAVPKVALSQLARDTSQKQTDAAISRALDFLAQQQAPTGSWKADAYGESTGATSLAVMAFLAAGHVPGEGPYGERLDRAVKWVLNQQQSSGMIVASRSHGPLYCHGISTLMLAEVTGMVDKSLAERCRRALERGVRLLLEAQNVAKDDRHAGGWRYQTTSQDSDLSVTAWQLLALRAAKNIGCDVPAESIERAVNYVRKCHAAENGGFAYQPGATPSSTRTGTGMVALEVCGRHLCDEVQRGAEYLRDKPLHPREQYFYYGAYYCSVAFYLVGGDERTAARRALADVLLERQGTDGSWQAENGSEQAAGKAYATSMAVLALAVDYHYLPIYQR